MKIAFPIYMLAELETFKPLWLDHPAIPGTSAWPLFETFEGASAFAIGIGRKDDLQIMECVEAGKLLDFMWNTRPRNLSEVWRRETTHGKSETQFALRVQHTAFFHWLREQAEEERQYRSN